jgi:hypothetical protein
LVVWDSKRRVFALEGDDLKQAVESADGSLCASASLVAVKVPS